MQDFSFCPDDGSSKFLRNVGNFTELLCITTVVHNAQVVLYVLVSLQGRRASCFVRLSKSTGLTDKLFRTS